MTVTNYDSDYQFHIKDIVRLNNDNEFALAN